MIDASHLTQYASWALTLGSPVTPFGCAQDHAHRLLAQFSFMNNLIQTASLFPLWPTGARS